MKKPIDNTREQELFDACYEFFNDNKRIKESDIPEAIKKLSAIFLAFSDVDTLDLTQREIFYRDHLLQVLTETLSTNKTLKSLTIELRHENDKLFHNCIADLLRGNKVLTSLSLPMSDIKSKGTDSIFDALKNNSTLTSLNLSGNVIGDEGIQAVCDCLMANSTLKSLNLEYNGIKDPASFEKLLHAVLNNNSLVALNLKGNRDALFLIIQSIDDKLDANRINTHKVPKGDVDLNAIAAGMARGGYREPIKRVDLTDMDIIHPVGLSRHNHILFTDLRARSKPNHAASDMLLQAPVLPVAQPPVRLPEPAMQVVNHPVVMQKPAGKLIQPQSPVPPQVEQSSNPLNEPSESMADYLKTFAGQPSLSEQLMALNLDDELTKQLEEPINLEFPDIPVRLNGVLHDYNTLLSLPPNANGQRIVPETRRNFYVIEISPDKDTKVAMLALIHQHKSAENVKGI